MFSLVKTARININWIRTKFHLSGGIYKQKNICTYKDDDSHYTCNKNIENKCINGLNILPVWFRENYRMRNFNLELNLRCHVRGTSGSRHVRMMLCLRYFRITTCTHVMFEILQDHYIYAWCYVWDTLWSRHLRMMLCLRYFRITTSTHNVRV